MEWEAETSDEDDHYFDFCYSIGMISVKDEEFENIGCVRATDTDYFDIFVNNFIQPIIEDECQHVELFKVDDVMKAVENDIPEEEEDPTKNFFDHFLLAVGDEDSDRDKGIAKKLKNRLMNMMKVKRGLTVDSGAADHVMPLGWLPVLLFAIVASLGSKRGLHYVAADGTRIPNLGQQLVRFMTLDGKWVELMFQIDAINKPLVSVSKLTEQGYKVVFDDDESYIYHKKTKQIIKMRKDRGVYVVDAYVPKQANSSFTRPR